ncbi:MAG: nucleotidyltransferase domain-containing protein [Gammaproteobacteria bacterium]|nr:nucleotidyltransferase domain-containing protein [Gammaproteobacteria bacterium]
MGTKQKSLSDALFTATQRRVLGLLFGNPDRSYYVNEILRLAGAGIGAVQRELEGLEAAGLVYVTRIGNQKHYQANRQSPIFEELRGIVIKTFGVADVLRAALASLARHVHAAFIYGSVAKGTDTASSDIDVMVVGDDISYPGIIGAFEKSEKTLGRAINPTLYNREELRRKLEADNAFLSRVLKQPRIFLIGSDDDIKASR